MDHDGGNGVLSRRQWVGRVAAPAVAAALGTGILDRRATAAEQTITPPDPNLRGARTYNIRDFGATGDGTTLDTSAVQAAIDAAHTDDGGTVLVPAGTFVIGTVELKSNVTLHLAAQGKLLGSPDIKDYHAGNNIPPSNGNIVLLSAANAENVTIEGPGTIDGNGAKFYTGHGDNTGPGQKSADGYFQRPHLLVCYKCANLRVSGAFLTASAYHCFRILSCNQVHLSGVRIHNRVNKNNDGFHINSSIHVHITDCDVACQDDACALFGSNQFVTVTNSTFSTRWSCFRFGGGTARNITISNCVIYETYGCAIKMRCGRNTVFENMLFSNLVMQDVTGPISIGLQSTSRRPSSSPASSQPSRGIVRNIAFNNIRATVVAAGRQHADLPFESVYRDGETRTCITLNGVGDEYLENVSLSDVHVTYEGGGTADEAARAVPPIAGEYFEIGTPPAYGLYARNVRGLTLQNVRLETANPDLRPAVVLDHVDDAGVTSLAVQGSPQAGSVLRLIDARRVLLTSPRLLSPAGTFLRVEGEGSTRITLDGGDISDAGKAVEFAAGASPQAVRLRN